MTHDLAPLRADIARRHALTEDLALDELLTGSKPDQAVCDQAPTKAADLIRTLRDSSRPGLMEAFLAEYGLSTREGIALMCLAEALLRVPDAETIDALIEDKIAPSAWGAHLGQSSSVLVNASTWALMLTGKVLAEEGDGLAASLQGAVRRLGEPVIRAAVGRAMREMGRQFVLGETIEAAMTRAAGMEAKGYTYSYDMLGEAALTQADADEFFAAYKDAIAALKGAGGDMHTRPGISIKLSALHPRYEEAQRHRLPELTARVLALAEAAADAEIGLNIDAEESERLEFSLDVIETALTSPSLAGWDGFGVVVQGYAKRAPAVIAWLQALAEAHDRRIMVRLVKGAYWDSEIKRAQVEGLSQFPVYTRKAATDAAYLCCAKLMLDADRIYPQFATHNAHSMAAILAMAGDRPFEFQRLHGMGETLHDEILSKHNSRCRIYAPVGTHRDLLAYLVRRLLENGANSSFVNQVMDPDVAPEEIAACPFATLKEAGKNAAVVPGPALFSPRTNSRGWDLGDRADLADAEAARDAAWDVQISGPMGLTGPKVAIHDPSEPEILVGEITEASRADVDRALTAAQPWAPDRDVLRRAADLYEADAGTLFALLTREAGKTLADAVSELREAVDFLRYYADESADLSAPPRGRIICISPWNFPLAIFTGQIAAALAAGNAVLAKPAEATPLVAARATALLHQAGVPKTALQLLPGQGAEIGSALSADPRVNGIAFTGSTATAQAINRSMAAHLAPDARLLAETGGLNAMIVDSTALPEQAVTDIITSAFRSAGQRCSALRVLYVQADIAPAMMAMLQGAMAELVNAAPARRDSDLGPLISADAKAKIDAHIADALAQGRLIQQARAPKHGHFVAPALIDLPGGIAALDEEIFGPVLHVTRFEASELDDVVAAINAKGYGLTFGLHTRIDDRVEAIDARIRAGNVYVNRNQIGAIVGSQPFGGEGLSGTGPKAGGPHYLGAFTQSLQGTASSGQPDQPSMDLKALNAALGALPDPKDTRLSATDLPGPTGESNRLTTHPRGRVLCLGPDAETQAELARASGCAALPHPGALDPAILTQADLLDAVIWWGDTETARALRQALAARPGPIIPLITAADPAPDLVLERQLCIDTTAAGGNATLLAAAG